MTVAIKAEAVGLSYRVIEKLTLQKRLSGGPPATGGQIVGDAKHRHVVALHDVTFSLEAGDRLGVVGANGAGKTTLLKVLYGIFEPTAGGVEISGKVDALFNINLGFRPLATGRRNIELRGLISGWSPQLIRERMDEIIEFSELGDFIDMPFKTYSQGMAARLAFSAATSLEPQILLMDEWIGAGDVAFQEKASKRMEDVTRRAGIIVIASHNYGLLTRTCNKILELEHGRVKAFESAETWFKKQPKRKT
jgi:ABC-type polysaccharide/polyol phosphate transport system ATPase subunit